MNWEQYKKEIELIEKQNNVEHDLYNIIADMIREGRLLPMFRYEI